MIDPYDFLTTDDRLELAEVEYRALVDAKHEALALDWRVFVAAALAAEGLTYRRYDDREVTVVYRCDHGGEPICVPDSYLDALPRAGHAAAGRRVHAEGAHLRPPAPWVGRRRRLRRT